MRLVALRGRAMARAGALEETGMSAVIGGDHETVLAELEAHGLSAANVNGAGQIVAAGRLAQLAGLADRPPTGARIRQLQVAGAFHTAFMAPAVAELAAAAAAITPSDPQCLLLSNRDGARVADGRDALDRLIAQVSRQVRWDLCMRTLTDLGVDAVIELPPAGALAGLVKRVMPTAARVALKTPADLASIDELLGQRTDQPSNRGPMS
jgi:[acyl-carrier-protein] S-malonyltransferase